MNEVIIKFLFAGDKFISEMLSRQTLALGKLRLTFSACGQFTKNKKRI